MRRQGQIAGAAGNHTDWKNKPGILGDYIDHQRVNLLAGVEPLGEAANVGAPSPVSSGFNLYPQQLSVVFDDEIVAATIKSTLSLGNSVQDACAAINKDWLAHGAAMLAAATAAETKANTVPVSTLASASNAKLSVASIPDGADIEVDGNFVGNTPSDIDVPAGDHAISIKKSGYKDWTKNIRVSAGSNIHIKPELEKAAGQ